MALPDGMIPREAREAETETVGSLRAERLARIAKLRSANENEKVLVALIFAVLFVGCVILGSTLEMRGIRWLPGVLILCLVLPTLALFFFYGPVKRLVRRLRRG